MRLVQRPADRYRLYTVALVVMLTLAGVGGQAGRGARAQEGFDLPPLDDYTGLTALTANSSDGVNLRDEPSVDGELLLSVPVGNVVDLRVDELNTVYTDDGIRWWPVRIWEIDGWIAGMYLEDTDGGADGEDVSDADQDADDAGDATTGDRVADAAAGAFAAGDFVAVATDDGGNLAMRAGPGTSESRIAWLGDGDVIQVVDGPIYNQNSAWYLITDGSINAYVFGDYLAGSSGDGSSDEGPSDGPSVDAPSEQAARFNAGNAVAPVDGIDYVNIRARVSANSGHLGALEEGAAVEVVDGPFYDADGDDWYLVDLGDGTEGYIWGDGLDRVSREQLGNAVAVADVEAVGEPEEVESGPTGTLVYPLADYVFTQAFGCSPFAFEPYDANLGCPYHNGIDLAAPLGTPLTAADGGTVKFAGWCDCGLGYYVEVEHGNGIATIYGHMNALYVSTGQTVAQGEVLGEVGSTGFSTGPHIHFMVKVGGVPVDPLGYLS